MPLKALIKYLKDFKVFTEKGIFDCQILNQQQLFVSRKIKLIWDFRGPTAQKIAEHHEIHLKEYMAVKGMASNITGHQQINEMYSLAFMVVTEEHMIQVRDALKPHRGELYQEQ